MQKQKQMPYTIITVSVLQIVQDSKPSKHYLNVSSISHFVFVTQTQLSAFCNIFKLRSTWLIIVQHVT